MNCVSIPPTLRKLVFSALIAILSISISFAQNVIIDENNLPGTPQTAWETNEGSSIDGFAQEFSVNKGETVHFKIKINSATPESYTIKIYRIGWYQGNGARFVTDLGNSLVGGMQPAYNYDNATGKVDCNNWAVSAQWTVPNDAATVSGVYLARFDCPATGGSSMQLFVVRDDAANAPVLFKTSDATWQAYNSYGGNSFYAAGTPVPGFTHATKISYQRPLYIRGDKSGFFNSEYPMIRFLEKNGYNMSYSTDMDMARDNSIMTPSIHKVILSVGHDEYWSLEQRTKFENARTNGVHVAFFSGNNVYWKTRWEDNYQTLVCYKEGTKGELVCGGKCDPLPNVWTGLWRDGCSPAYAANDGCRPEAAFTGQMSWTQSTGSIKVPDTYKNLRVWKNTSIASLGAGQTVTLPYGTLGNEWDPEQYAETYPAHRIILSNTVQSGLVHKMSLLKYSSGALVFSAGTMQWPWGLDVKHDLNTATPPVQAVSADMQQATVNILHDMDADAASLQAGLVAPTIGADALAPSTTIISPAHNATIAGANVTITGTSADNGPSAVAGVEVSVDNGVTWQQATGLENWTFTFSPTGYGTITIKVRAWDDMGNIEVPGAPGSPNSINISLSGPFNHSVFNATYPQTTPTFFQGSPVELGMKFNSTVAGYITGFRYYKTAGVTGVHTGHLWDNTGTLLASQVFTNETSTGWQSVQLTTPVAITPNTTYIVSYFSSTGDFVRQVPFFTQPVINGFLRGLADGEDGGNGVYAYSATPIYPDNSSGSSNYYADVLFQSADVTAPQVINVTPANNSLNNLLNVQPTATFDENIDPGTITNSTVVMTDPGNAVVLGTPSVNGATVTFTPTSSLAIGTIYTVRLSGGINEPLIKDLSGNAMVGDYTWSFKTGGVTAPVVTTSPSSQTTCLNSSISFTSAATGIPTPTVQWQVSTDNGGTWNNISGATSATYTFTALSGDNNNQFKAVWTNSEGTAISDPATLTIAANITGSISAVNPSVCPGDPLQLVLTAATGPSPYTLIINSVTYPGVTVGTPFSPLAANETIWPNVTTPQDLVIPDSGPVEVGVKFSSNKNGVIRGIRFYKGSTANGGAHVGSLWSQSGTLLGQATFTGETASGWQEVLFAAPVSINANTTYVASYFLPQGNYSRNGSYFSTSFSNGNSLTALQNTGLEPNGVYFYTGSPAFPTDNAGDQNYWVDVIFAANSTTTATYNLTNITANNGCLLSGSPISTASIVVTAVVNPGAVTGTSPLCIGATVTYTSNGDIGGTWSSSNTLVATVNTTTGLVTAVGAGTANIIYTVTGCDGTKTAFQILNVPPNANAGTVSGTSPLCINATTTYTSNGDAGGTWSSSNALVATVNATTGLVTAVAAGTVNIIYTVGCNATAAASLTVNPNGNPGTVSGSSPLCVGATATYTSNGDAGGTWSSDNILVATVNISTGLVTAVAPGTANIAYTVTGCNGTASASVTVNSSANPGTVTGTSPLCIGATATYSSNGDAGGSWSTSNALIATVNPTTGLVTAVAQGSVNIIYTLNTGCNTPVSSFAILAVSPNANAGTVTGLSPLCISSTATYTNNGDAGGSWSSSNILIASVNATTGLVTAVNTGTADIIYTVGCNASAFTTVSVSVNANAGTVTGATGLCIGATTTYTSNGDAGGSWSSSNSLVATVNATTGLVTAVSGGSVNIIYTVSTGCNNPVTASAVFTVAAQVTGTIAAVNSNICPGAPMQLVLTGATGPAPYSLVINSNTYNGITVGTPFIAVGASETVWTPADVPQILTQADPGPVEVGVKFRANKNGVIKGIRFYKGGVANGGTHVGSLWNLSGTLLGQATFTSETNSGWQEVLFTTPVAVTANTLYVASYFAPLGNYSLDGSYFSVDYSNGNSLTAIQYTVSEPNPVFEYAGNPTFPTLNFGGNSNYWVDVVFAPYTTTTTTFNLTNITASNGCTLSGSPISSATITVSATVNAGTVSGLSPLCIGATATYLTNGDAGGSWSSTNTLVATVNPTTGLVTAVGAGTSDIIYTVTGCTGTVSNFQTVTVNPNANPGTVSGTSPLCIGATATYTSNGEANGVWSSTNPLVATVNPTTGLVTAVAAGTTDIKYTLNVGCNSPLNSFKTLTVSPDANAGTVSGPSSLCTTSTFTYTSNGDAGGTWNSSNPLIATINPTTGLVTAINAGSTNITYAINTGCGAPVTSAALVLTVNLIPNAGTVSGTSPLCIGATDTYTSNGVGGGTWSSTNPSVASVNASSGLVTALAAGTTDITYTLSGCLLPVSSSKTLTVINCTNTVNLKLYLKGYYIGGGLMQPVLSNQGIGASTTNTDNITVELHNSTAPYAIVATTTGMLKTDGTCTVSFPSSFSGSYYLAIKHRNTIQTWSATAVPMAPTVSYDFSTAANKAYGDNMTDLGDGRWAFFTGDINQDENIDLLDYPSLDFDINNFSSGFYPTDLNGDGNVDLIDYPIWDANNSNFISSVHP